MRVHTWRRLMLFACGMGLLALGAVACDSSAKEVIVRPQADGFVVIGTIGSETDFHLLNDSDRDLDVQVVALNGHSVTELHDALSGGGDLPEWATPVGTIQAAAGKAATATVETGDGEYALVELVDSGPVVAALHRTEPQGAPIEGANSGSAAAEATVTLAPLPAAGPVGSASGTVNVTMKEFSVAAQPASTASGQITFNLKNEGAVVHELVVIRTEIDAADLPQSGGKVDETSVAIEVKGKIQNVAGGASGQPMTAGLPAGKYVLICNVPGHYGAGMHTGLTVQ